MLSGKGTHIGASAQQMLTHAYFLLSPAIVVQLRHESVFDAGSLEVRGPYYFSPSLFFYQFLR
jgi:hypothetical protein